MSGGVGPFPEPFPPPGGFPQGDFRLYLENFIFTTHDTLYSVFITKKQVNDNSVIMTDKKPENK